MAATITSNKFRANGMPIVITSQSTTSSELGIDSDKSPSKHAVVHKLSVNGQEVDILVRVHLANGSIFVDLVADSSVANLTTRVAALSLTGVGHPSPAKDKADTQAMVAAGGS